MDGTDGDDAPHAAPLSPITRRGFLGIGAGVTAAVLIPSCTPRASPPDHAHPPEGARDRPQPGLQVPEAQTVGQFLNPEQRAMVTAILARLIPGDEDDPGAVEAGAVEYIDRLLATHDSYPQRTYTKGPFAETYEGDEEPEPEDGVIWIQEDELKRYGWQSGYTPREIYRMGLSRLEALTQDRYATSFADLDTADQDEVLAAVEDAEDDDVSETFAPIGGATFFALILKHTVEGFLADPMYGGNRDLVGWNHIGFPGAQRAYAPQEMVDPNFFRQPQSLAGLAMLHGDHGDDDALGSVRRRHPAGPID